MAYWPYTRYSNNTGYQVRHFKSIACHVSFHFQGYFLLFCCGRLPFRLDGKKPNQVENGLAFLQVIGKLSPNIIHTFPFLQWQSRASSKSDETPPDETNVGTGSIWNNDKMVCALLTQRYTEEPALSSAQSCFADHWKTHCPVTNTWLRIVFVKTSEKLHVTFRLDWTVYVKCSNLGDYLIIFLVIKIT